MNGARPGSAELTGQSGSEAAFPVRAAVNVVTRSFPSYFGAAPNNRCSEEGRRCIASVGGWPLPALDSVCDSGTGACGQPRAFSPTGRGSSGRTLARSRAGQSTSTLQTVKILADIQNLLPSRCRQLQYQRLVFRWDGGLVGNFDRRRATTNTERSGLPFQPAILPLVVDARIDRPAKHKRRFIRLSRTNSPSDVPVSRALRAAPT